MPERKYPVPRKATARVVAHPRAPRPVESTTDAPTVRVKGPLVKPEPSDLNPLARLNVVFVDVGMKFQFFALYMFGITLTAPDPSPLRSGVMAYVFNHDIWAPFIDDFYINNLSVKFQVTCFSRSAVWLPANFLGTPYRFLDTGMPLPSEGVDVLNLSVKVGGRTINVMEGPDLKKKESAERRLAKALSTAEPDPALVSSLTKEVAESSMPSGTNICRADLPDPLPNQYWYKHSLADQRSLWRDSGVLNSRIQLGRHKVSVDCPLHFESFDPSDTDNFKVVKRFNPDETLATFDSEEVPIGKLNTRSKAQARIYLVPRIWRVQYSYQMYLTEKWIDPATFALPDVYFEGFLPATNEVFVPAFASPFCLEGWSSPPYPALFPSHPEYLFSYSNTAYDPNDISDASRLRLMTQLSVWWSIIEGAFPHILVGPYISSQPGIQYVFSGVNLNARSSATVTVTQNGCPAKMLVGAVEFEDRDSDRYFVFRKTPRVVPAPEVIYDGPFDHTGYSNSSELPHFVYMAPLYPTSFNVAIGGSPPSPPSLPNPRFPWTDGGLCVTENLWPYMMRPHWL